MTRVSLQMNPVLYTFPCILLPGLLGRQLYQLNQHHNLPLILPQHNLHLHLYRQPLIPALGLTLRLNSYPMFLQDM